MSLRDEYIKAGIIKPAGVVAEPVARRPRDVVGLVLPSDRPKAHKGSKAAKPLEKSVPPKKKTAKKHSFPIAIHPKPKPLFCPLCGEKVPGGTLLEHKSLAHGESLYSRRSKRTAPIYVEKATFVQGGAPGLKKR
ncbi:hypothetical protein HA052_16035 [Chromobacterium haemolyticum]|uniref:C2H2-type domain-containing protein n=1 Tax=Chromobacterium fluminis TaxID=3044269 RepID=A0ABX0L4E4_9NEIS|nr:hypothetical protein [Chromobacterium haemolyticum]